MLQHFRMTLGTTACLAAANFFWVQPLLERSLRAEVVGILLLLALLADELNRLRTPRWPTG